MVAEDIPKSAPKEGSKLKSRIKRAKWLVEEFLEENLQLDALKNNPARVEGLGTGLKENLLHEELHEGLGHRSYDYIFRYHYILKIIWIQFKKALTEFRRSGGKFLIQNPITSKIVELEQGSFSIKIETEIKDDPTRNIFDTLGFGPEYSELYSSVKVAFNTGNVHFLTDRLEVVRCVLSLLEDLPVDRICECSDESCKRWFIKTDKRKRYCSNVCASRANQRDIRHNPEKIETYEQIKKSQRARYRKKVLGEEVA